MEGICYEEGVASPGLRLIRLADHFVRPDLKHNSSYHYSAVVAMIKSAIRAGFRFDPTDLTDGYSVRDIHLEELHIAACQTHNGTASTAVRHALERPAFYYGGRGIANEVFVGRQIRWRGEWCRCTSIHHSKKRGHYIVAKTSPREDELDKPIRLIRISHTQFLEAERKRRGANQSRGHVRR
jgi:hypothetical protein